MPISESAHRVKFAFVFSMRLAERSIGGERLGRFGFICVPSASRGHVVERAVNSLHRAGINAKTKSQRRFCEGYFRTADRPRISRLNHPNRDIPAR
jgi:hypothetical protein